MKTNSLKAARVPKVNERRGRFSSFRNTRSDSSPEFLPLEKIFHKIFTPLIRLSSTFIRLAWDKRTQNSHLNMHKHVSRKNCRAAWSQNISRPEFFRTRNTFLASNLSCAKSKKILFWFPQKNIFHCFFLSPGFTGREIARICEEKQPREWISI